jgi:hypothetical protein
MQDSHKSWSIAQTSWQIKNKVNIEHRQYMPTKNLAFEKMEAVLTIVQDFSD